MITKNTIKQIASLRQQKFRKELGLFVVEGRKMTEELLQSNFETVGLYATEAFLADHPAFANAEIVSEVQMDQMSGQDTPPGILAVVKIPQQSEIKTTSRLVLAWMASPIRATWERSYARLSGLASMTWCAVPTVWSFGTLRRCRLLWVRFSG